MSFLLLACSRTASLVCLAPALPSPYDVFWLCFACCSEHVFVCLFSCFFVISYHWQLVCLLLSVLRASMFLLYSVSCYFFPVAIQSQPAGFTLLPFFACHCVFTCNCLYLDELAGVQCGSKCDSYFFVLFICLFMGLLVFSSLLCVEFWVTFSVSFFELNVHGCLQASVENIMKEKMPKKGGRWWFSWRSRNSESKSVSGQIHLLLWRLFYIICMVGAILVPQHQHMMFQSIKPIVTFELCALQESATEAGGDLGESSLSMNRWVQAGKCLLFACYLLNWPHFSPKHSHSHLFPVFDFSGWRMSHPPVMRTTDHSVRCQDPVCHSPLWLLAASSSRLFGSPLSNWCSIYSYTWFCWLWGNSCR